MMAFLLLENLSQLVPCLVLESDNKGKVVPLINLSTTP
jgi:hypothetical protein